MKKSKKVWMITAASCMVVGGILAVSAIAASMGEVPQTSAEEDAPTWGGIDFSQFSTVSYEMKTYSITDRFSNLEINTGWQNVSFLPAEDGKCRVECAENEDLTYTVKVEGDTLRVIQNDNSQWYDKVGVFSPENAQVTIYLPQGEYGQLSVVTSSGNIAVPSGLTFSSAIVKATSGEVGVKSEITENLEAESSSGNIVVEGFKGKTFSAAAISGNITASGIEAQEQVSRQATSGEVGLSSCWAKEISLSCTSGDVALNDTRAQEKMEVQTTSGNVALSACDAEDIRIQTSSGDVGGSLLSEKRFAVQTSSGDVVVPDSPQASQICQIITTSGNVAFVEK